jgi:dTDP-4-amino-4,6-dideoxygalactose transaminase
LEDQVEHLPFARPEVDEETIQAVIDVFRSGWLATGPKVKEFEEKIAE